MKCDICANSRPIVSENGVHYICCLPSKQAIECMTGKKERQIRLKSIRDIRESEVDNAE